MRDRKRAPMTVPLDRRHLLGAFAAIGALPLATTGSEAQRFVAPEKMKPGDFTWQPEASPSGAVVLIVSIPEQLVHVYRNGVEIGVSTCSTGKPGHRTPTGVFTILEKDKKHVSSIYKGAQMPNMERLTWTGIALHAGNLPGYPASHGCIRLPLTFSAKLFEVTRLGVVVIIADERTQPATVVHPGVMLPSVAETEAQALATRVASKPSPGGWQTNVAYPLTSVIISRADGMAYLNQDGELTGRYPVRIAEQRRPLGTHAYTLIGQTADGSALAWMALGLGKTPHDAHIVNWSGDGALRRISFYDPAKARDVASHIHPGTTLLVTDASAPRTTRTTGKNFSIITSEPLS